MPSTNNHIELMRFSLFYFKKKIVKKLLIKKCYFFFYFCCLFFERGFLLSLLQVRVALKSWSSMVFNPPTVVVRSGFLYPYTRGEGTIARLWSLPWKWLLCWCYFTLLFLSLLFFNSLLLSYFSFFIIKYFFLMSGGLPIFFSLLTQDMRSLPLDSHLPFLWPIMLCLISLV